MTSLALSISCSHYFIDCPWNIRTLTFRVFVWLWRELSEGQSFLFLLKKNGMTLEIIWSLFTQYFPKRIRIFFYSNVSSFSVEVKNIFKNEKKDLQYFSLIIKNNTDFLARFVKSMDSTDILISRKSSGNSSPIEDSINVVVRVRPLNEKEKKAREESIIQFPGNGQILVSNIHHLMVKLE